MQLTTSVLLLVLLSVCISGCSNSLNDEIVDVKRDFEFYNVLHSTLIKQKDADYLKVAGDAYVFQHGDYVFSGKFNIQTTFIEQTHYKNIPLTENYKKRILKWLVFSEENQISGFDVRNNKTLSSIFIKPEVELLFLNENYEDSWKEKPDKWEDYRGVTHARIKEKVYLIFE